LHTITVIGTGAGAGLWGTSLGKFNDQADEWKKINSNGNGKESKELDRLRLTAHNTWCFGGGGFFANFVIHQSLLAFVLVLAFCFLLFFVIPHACICSPPLSVPLLAWAALFNHWGNRREGLCVSLAGGFCC
jgi:hypothetical protein